MLRRNTSFNASLIRLNRENFVCSLLTFLISACTNRDQMPSLKRIVFLQSSTFAVVYFLSTIDLESTEPPFSQRMDVPKSEAGSQEGVANVKPTYFDQGPNFTLSEFQKVNAIKLETNYQNEGRLAFQERRNRQKPSVT